MSSSERYTEASAKFEAHYGLNPPASDVCSFCRGPKNQGYSKCYNCGHNASYLEGLGSVDEFRTVSICISGTQFYQDLKNYKSDRVADKVKNRIGVDLMFVLARFINENKQTFKPYLGSGIVTWLPSTQRSKAPLGKLVTSLFKKRFDARELLRFTGEMGPERRKPFLGRFEVIDDVADKNVLIVDDLWTSGAHVFSAAASLKKAGAAQVCALTLGRFIRREHYPEYVDDLAEEFSWAWPPMESSWDLF